MRSPLLNKRSLSSKRKQKGAVAVVVGLSLVTLLAMGGVVLDLGHLYIAKSELQNAADAAALAGARSLDETTAGVTDAVLKAQAIGGKNNYNFSTVVSLSATTDIQFGSSPDGPWYNSTALPNPPKGITFVKVNTGSKSLDTYLMRVVGATFNTVSTSGVAVAGRFVVNVTPMGVCAIDPDNRTTARPTTNELVEFGFRRGLTYNIPELGPLGAAGVPMYLNPVESAPTACVNNHSNVPFTKSFVCNGNSAIGSGVSVYANTGGSYGPIEKALNSRFDDLSSFGPAGCDVAQAPPDSNVKDYDITLPSPGRPADWMDPDPVATSTPPGQSIKIDPLTKKPQNFPLNPSTTADFGVLWSYSRAVRAAGTSPNFTAGAPFTPTDADWTTLYAVNGGTAHPTPTSYPASSPYSQTSGNFFEQPSIVAHRPGVLNRRLMNLVIVDCSGLSGPGNLSCATLPVKGIGRFFLQARADLTGNPKKMYTEFAGLIEPAPTSEIKLYR